MPLYLRTNESGQPGMTRGSAEGEIGRLGSRRNKCLLDLQEKWKGRERSTCITPLPLPCRVSAPPKERDYTYRALWGAEETLSSGFPLCAQSPVPGSAPPPSNQGLPLFLSYCDKILRQQQLKRQRVYSSFLLRAQSFTLGKSRPPELDAAGHITSAIRETKMNGSPFPVYIVQNPLARERTWHN